MWLAPRHAEIGFIVPSSIWSYLCCLSSWFCISFLILTAAPTCLLFFFFLMIRPPPRSPLFPYTPLSRSARVPGPREPAGRHDGKLVLQNHVAPPRELGPEQLAHTRVMGRADEARGGELGQHPPVLVHAASSRASRSRSDGDTGASGGRQGPPYSPTASMAALTPAGPCLPTISRSSGASRCWSAPARWRSPQWNAA